MRRHLRTARAVARDPRIPRWLRALLLFGILPIPGPFDNLALIAGVIILFTAYRPVLTQHYAIQGLPPHLAMDTWGGWS